MNDQKPDPPTVAVCEYCGRKFSMVPPGVTTDLFHYFVARDGGKVVSDRICGGRLIFTASGSVSSGDAALTRETK